MQRMEIEAITRAMKQIAPDRAEALILHHFSGLAHSEIGVVLKKSVDTIGVLIARGWQDLCPHAHPLQSMETTTSKEPNPLNLEVERLVDKLNSIAAQIVPDPLFVSELEQTMALNYRPKTRWTLPLKQFTTAVGWAMLIGLTFFLLSWRVDPSQSSTFQATARPATQTAAKAVVSTTTSTPRRPVSSHIVTATTIPMQEYIVQAGDTCTYIAERHGVTINQLILFNRLNSTCDIWVDQKLVIPIITTTTP
jgi:LysM repeat protein